MVSHSAEVAMVLALLWQALPSVGILPSVKVLMLE